MTAPRPSLDRSSPPAPLQAAPFRFPRIESGQYQNLRVVMAQVPRASLTHLLLVFAGAAQFDPPGQAGLARLTCDLMLYGSKVPQADDPISKIESLGGRINAKAGWDASYLSTRVLSSKAPSAARRLKELAQQPEFSEQQIFRLKRQYMGELVRLSGHPGRQAEEQLLKLLYGSGPYSRSLVGTRESLIRLERSHIQDFYERYVKGSGGVLVAAGDGAPDLAPDAQPLTGPPKPASWPDPPEIAPVGLESGEVRVVNQAQASQSMLLIGQAGPPRDHPDFMAATVLNHILGGHQGSRVNLNLRERHGYTYGARSQLDGRSGPGPWTISASLENDAVGNAAQEVLGEMRRLQEDPVPPQELRQAVESLTNSLILSCQSVSSVASRLMDLAVYRMAPRYYQGWTGQLRSLTPQDVMRTARNHLSAQTPAIVALGPANRLASQLEDLGGLEVVEPQPMQRRPGSKPAGGPF